MGKRIFFIESLLFLALISIVFIGLFYDLISSGFHFMDDYNFAIINRLLQEGENILTVTNSYIESDLTSSRYRPLYELMWVLEIKLLGANYNAHLFLRIFYLIFSAFFFYLFVRGKILQYDFWLALVFVAVIFCGEQLAIYYMFGSGEARSLLFIVISFYFLNYLHQPQGNNKKLLYRILIYFFAFLSSLCKESFITSITILV
jgi:hypothetical protein